MFKIIREDDVVYFCNAVGEVFCWDFHTKDGKPDLSLENPYSSAGLVTVDIDSERIPEALRRAYEAAWSEGYGFPCYIALVDGVPCLLLIAEFGDLPDDGKRSTELREESVAFARRLEQDLRKSKEVVRTVDVLFPEDVRSPFCQWEVIIAVPVEAGKVTVKEMCAISKVALHCLDGCDIPNANVTIQQVSMSKKWASTPALDERGKPLLNANGKTVLRKSYSVLQDDFFAAMRKAGYDDVERGERGSSEEHLTVTQFKVQQEQARLAELTEQNRQQEQQAATLGRQIEKIQNQQVAVAAIEKIEAKSVPFSNKVAVEREDFERLSALAKKYITAEKKESKLQKALDAANRLIEELKAKVTSLTKELSEYKSIRGKLNAAGLEQENEALRGKLQSYEAVIERNNLWRVFGRNRAKAHTKDETR